MKRLWLVLGLFVVLVYFTPDVVYAQCSMCRTALEQNAEAATAFNRAILFLLGVPYLLFTTIAGLYLWNRHKRVSDGTSVTT